MEYQITQTHTSTLIKVILLTFAFPFQFPLVIAFYPFNASARLRHLLDIPEIEAQSKHKSQNLLWEQWGRVRAQPPLEQPHVQSDGTIH